VPSHPHPLSPEGRGACFPVTFNILYLVPEVGYPLPTLWDFMRAEKPGHRHQNETRSEEVRRAGDQAMMIEPAGTARAIGSAEAAQGAALRAFGREQRVFTR